MAMNTEPSAPMTPFEQWWQTLRPAVTMEDWQSLDWQSLARQAFEAGYAAAVKAHDASGCPRIFMDVPDDYTDRSDGLVRGPFRS